MVPITPLAPYRAAGSGTGSEGLARSGFRFDRPKAERPPVSSLFPDGLPGTRPLDDLFSTDPSGAASRDACACGSNAPAGDRIDIQSLDVRYTHVQAMLHIEDGAKSGLQNGFYQLDITQLQVRLKAIAAYAGKPPADPAAAKASPSPKEPPGDGKDAPNDFLQKLLDYFSPEKTSDRIFTHALQGYGRGSFDKSDDAGQRERFRDFILPYIEKGFGEARDMLGKLPDDVAAKVDKTLDLIKDRFQKFTDGPSADEKA